MKKILFIALTIFMHACAYYPSSAATKIIEASEREVAKCKLLGQVYGDAGGLYFSSIGVQIAKDHAKEQAAHIGATHIYWIEENVRVNPFFIGKAYRCNFAR